MNNKVVEQGLDDCARELDDLAILIKSLGPASAVVPYLTKYAIVRACGSLEQAFKALIADYCSHRSKKQVKRFLRVRVRESSSNPSYTNMCSHLKDFDEDWHLLFKRTVDGDQDKIQLLASLQSLVDARNDFAHGGNPTASIGDVIGYFDHSRRLVEYMDVVVA